MRISFAILGCLLLVLPLNAQLTFIVERLPENTPEDDTLFLSGEINDWAAASPDYFFKRDSLGGYFLTLGNRAKSPFEYKITRGSWERVETDSLGHFIDNRRYEGEIDTVVLKIKSWDDLPVMPHLGWLNLRIESVPDNTPQGAALFAVGSFNAWHTDEPAYQLQLQKDGSYFVRIPIISDTTFYKFGRGSWETIEGRRNGRARVNRQFVLGRDDPSNQVLKIESWEDLARRPINSYTFLLLLAAFQGLLLILAINTLQDHNRAANRVLSVLLLLLSVALAGRVSTYDREIFNWLPHLLLLPDFIYFLYAPVFLIYINRLLRLPSKISSGIRWWQFLPFLLQVAFYLPLILMSKEVFIAKVVDQELKPFFAWAGGLALIYNSVYWFICWRTIQQYERESGDSHAFESNLAFLKVVVWLKLACLVIWMVTYLIGGIGILMESDLSYLTDKTTDSLWVVFALTAFFLGYYTMRQPEIFKLPPTDIEPSVQILDAQEKASSMDEVEMNGIKEKLEQTMQAEQPYTNPGLSLNQLAELVGTSPHSLSKVINEGYQMNFNDFVNSYRIQEFKRLAQQEKYKNYTLVAIAFMVGFNSKSAFNRSFKKLEKCTPGEFLKQINE